MMTVRFVPLLSVVALAALGAVLALALAGAGLFAKGGPSPVALQRGAGPVASPTVPPRTPAPGSPPALLAHWREWNPALGGWSADVVPMDPATAAEIQREPLDFGYGPTMSASEDGRLAAVTNLGANEIEIFDLVSWTLLRAIEAAPGLRPDRWSQDGSRLLAWRDYCPGPNSEGRCLTQWERDLWEIDAARGTARPIASFDFSVWEVAVHWPVDGAPARAYALGVHTDLCCGIDPQGDPFIVAIDIETGRSQEMALPGMLIGQPHQRLGDTNVYASYHPAIALAPDGSRLYVVDPVDDRVTIVDAHAMKVERTVDFERGASTWSRLGGWLRSLLVGAAEAKGGPAYLRTAEVTPDGRYLVISGFYAQKEPSQDEPVWTSRPAGLKVIDTATLKVVFREESIGSFQITTDGRWLLGHGSYWDFGHADEDGDGRLVPSGVNVLDLTSLRVAHHWWPDEQVEVAALSPDSRYAYLTRHGTAAEPVGGSEADCTPSGCARLSVLDLRRGEVVAERLLESDSSIMSLTRRP